MTTTRMTKTGMTITRRLLAALALLVFTAGSAVAQSTLGPADDAPAAPDAERKIIESSCFAFAQRSPLVRWANFQPQNLADDEVGLTFVGHSTFLIETANGLTAATDYAGYAGPGVTPEIVTMNHAP